MAKSARSPFFRFALSISVSWAVIATAYALFVPDAREHFISLGEDNRCKDVGDWAARVICQDHLDVSFARLFIEGALSAGLFWVITPIAILLAAAAFEGRYVSWIKRG